MDDSRFTGAIPDLYQRNLVPLLFEPWAALLVERIAELAPHAVLETAAGTGVLTRALARRFPGARLVATDLNPAMLDIAASSLPPSVELLPGDATDLPLGNRLFDVVASQFGIMFYDDRVKGFREAVRVLRPGGTMIAAVWGALADNPLSAAVHDAMAVAFPSDPPAFIGRTPFGYHDADQIINEAETGGFDTVSVEQLTLPHPRLDAASAVDGLCLGSPLRAEIEARGTDAMERALDAAREAVRPRADADGKIDTTMTALIITAST